MPKQPTEYIHMFNSGVDRMVVSFLTDHQTVVKFSVQHETLIDGRWRKVVRYDNAHDGPHRHTFHPDDSERRVVMAKSNDNDAFTMAQDDVKRNFKKLRERYIMSIRKGG